MINLKESIAIVLISIILGFFISLITSFQAFFYSLLIIFIVILINILAKKITAYYLDSQIEIKIWNFQQWGYKKSQYMKKPFPIGIFMPILTAIITLGYVVWSACLTFDVKAKQYRAAKRHGLYTFSEMTEYHIGLIAASGIIINLIFALIGYLAGLTEFARLNIYFAFFNMIPLSDLDGNKVFFGSLVLWSFLAIITLIALAYTILLI